MISIKSSVDTRAAAPIFRSLGTRRINSIISQYCFIVYFILWLIGLKDCWYCVMDTGRLLDVLYDCDRSNLRTQSHGRVRGTSTVRITCFATHSAAFHEYFVEKYNSFIWIPSREAEFQKESN